MDNSRDIEAAASLARLNHVLQSARGEWDNLCRLVRPEDPLFTDLYVACQEVTPLRGAAELLTCVWLIQEVVQEHIEGPGYVVLHWPASIWRDLAAHIEGDQPDVAARIRRALPVHRDEEVDVECTLREARLLRKAAAELS